MEREGGVGSIPNLERDGVYPKLSGERGGGGGDEYFLNPVEKGGDTVLVSPPPQR